MKLPKEAAEKIMRENHNNLDLSGMQITALPEGLTVGGSLYLSGTQITALPEGLTVGGCLDLRGTQIKKTEHRKVHILHNGDYKQGRYLYADGILTHVKSKRKIGEYTWFQGKIPGKNVITDGTYFAHCRTIREGITDLTFKKAKNRGADQYRDLDLDTPHTVEELVTMYRIITGACKQGSEDFVASLGDTIKEQYTIREAIQITQGQYQADAFERFFLGDRQ